MPPGGTTEHENYSPFLKGVQGMSCNEPGAGNPKDTPPHPLIGGILKGAKL